MAMLRAGGSAAASIMIKQQLWEHPRWGDASICCCERHWHIHCYAQQQCCRCTCKHGGVVGSRLHPHAKHSCILGAVPPDTPSCVCGCLAQVVPYPSQDCAAVTAWNPRRPTLCTADGDPSITGFCDADRESCGWHQR
jgi:hypothetical protein